MSTDDSRQREHNDRARSLAHVYRAASPDGSTASIPWLVDNGRAAFDVTLPDGRTARVTVAVSS